MDTVVSKVKPVTIIKCMVITSNTLVHGFQQVRPSICFMWQYSRKKIDPVLLELPSCPHKQRFLQTRIRCLGFIVSTLIISNQPAFLQAQPPRQILQLSYKTPSFIDNPHLQDNQTYLSCFNHGCPEETPRGIGVFKILISFHSIQSNQNLKRSSDQVSN